MSAAPTGETEGRNYPGARLEVPAPSYASDLGNIRLMGDTREALASGNQLEELLLGPLVIHGDEFSPSSDLTHVKS